MRSFSHGGFPALSTVALATSGHLMTPINTLKLVETAFAILVKDLERRNTLSPLHRAALMELLDTFAGYCAGTLSGRRAFPLGTGLGKTASVVAFLAALHRCGYAVPVSVAASKVEALCELKMALMDHGVPEGCIGLKHSLPAASLPSTGNDDRLFMLVSHARVRSNGKDFDLFGRHLGEDRALTIYDESLISSDSFAVNALDVFTANAALGAVVEYQHDKHLAELHGYFQDCVGTIKAELAVLQDDARDVHRNGRPVQLGIRDEATIEAWTALLQRNRGTLKVAADILEAFLAVCQFPLQVLKSADGAGVVAIMQAVPLRLRDIVILDASGPIRELVRLDRSITAVASFPPGDLKSFENVSVHQLMASGSRTALEQSYAEAGREGAAVTREVMEIVRREATEDPARCFLFFSFIKRGSLDILKELRTAIARAGFDLEAVLPLGPGDRAPRKRFSFLTWGQHEALNGFEHAQTVILCGVLHRSHLDMAAAVKGQAGYLAAPTPHSIVKQVLDGELAHCVYQAASRGSCRNVDNGKAVAMRLHVIHRGYGLKTLLDRVMPGAAWTFDDPAHLKRAKAAGKTAEMLGRLLDHLRTIPHDINKVSSRAIKEAMAVPDDEASKSAFKRAAAALEASEHGWSAEGRSVARAVVTYGFQS